MTYRRVCPLLILGLFLTLPGCFLGNIFIPLPEDLPDPLQAALDNADALVEASDDPLAHVAAGTVRDDLDTLDGCWAVYRSASSPLQPGITLDLSVVLHFDAADGTLVRYVYQNTYGFGADITVQTGTFTVDDAGTLEVRVTKVEANVFGEIRDVTDLYDVPVVYEVRATLDDDRLKALFELPPDPTKRVGLADDNAFIFVPVDCL